MTEPYSLPTNPLQAMRDQIDTLTAERDNARKYSTARLATIDNLGEKIRKAEQCISDMVEHGVIDEDVFVEVAGIFGWDVEKEIEVTVTAVFKGTITVPRNTDTNYLDEKFSVSCDADGDGIAGYLDCDELNVEVN